MSKKRSQQIVLTVQDCAVAAFALEQLNKRLVGMAPPHHLKAIEKAHKTFTLLSNGIA